MLTRTRFSRTLAAAMTLAALPFTAACGGADEPAAGVGPVTNSVAPVNPPLSSPATPAATSPPSSAATSPAPSATGPSTVGETGGELSQEALAGRIGEKVTVTGEVAEVLNANAFTLGGDEFGENPLLVVNAKPTSLRAGEQVRVSGEVIRFSVPGIEEDFDLDLVDDEFEDFDGDPALRAASVTDA